MNVQEIFEWVNFVANKLQSGAVSPEQFNRGLQVVNIEIFNKKYGLPEDYRIEIAQPRVTYQRTQKIIDDTWHFVKPVTINKVGLVFPIPADYYAFSSLTYTYVKNRDITDPCCFESQDLEPDIQEQSVDIATDIEFKFRLNNNVTKPTFNNPMARYTLSGLEVRPIEINRINLTYLKKPNTPFRAFTVVNDESIYDPVGSTQIEFPETVHPEFCVRIAKYFGINLRDEELYGMMEKRQAAGE
jgi:hypothetical protein